MTWNSLGEETWPGRCREAITLAPGRHSHEQWWQQIGSQGNKACLLSRNSLVCLSCAGRSLECLKQAQPWPAPLTPPLFLSSVSQALQCYSFQHIYFGPFDLSRMKFSNVSCPHGCAESVLSLDTGEGRQAPKKGAGCAEEKGVGQGQG